MGGKKGSRDWLQSLCSEEGNRKNQQEGLERGCWKMESRKPSGGCAWGKKQESYRLRVLWWLESSRGASCLDKFKRKVEIRSTDSFQRVLVHGMPTTRLNLKRKASGCNADSLLLWFPLTSNIYYLVLVLKSLIRLKPVHICNIYTILPPFGLMEVPGRDSKLSVGYNESSIRPRKIKGKRFGSETKLSSVNRHVAHVCLSPFEVVWF